MGRSHQQVGLPAKEGRDLQYIYISRGHGRFVTFVNIGYGWHAECFTYFLQYFQGFFIADPGKGIEPGTVCLAVGTLENI